MPTVAVSGSHTQAEVRAQMSLLRRERGPRAHAQLIGGEVSLLPPDDHAAALQIMRDHGREPMSFTHGDFDYEYLRDVALGPDLHRRLARMSFAAHFDMMMFGRRGIERPPDEASLNPYRQSFANKFARLKREHGVRYFLAHNMTVTPSNVDQIAAVVLGVTQTQGLVRAAQFAGSHLTVDVEVGGRLLRVQSPLGRPVTMGERVTVGFAASALHGVPGGRSMSCHCSGTSRPS